METNCKRCLLFSQAGKKLEETIQAYIASLNDNEKVFSDEYEERLMKCEKCDALINGLCKYCGCFVIVRAVKKNQSCPFPQNHKW